MRIRNLVLFLSLSCVVGVHVAHAQALLAPAENFVVNRAEAAIISRVAISRGFAANDPRIASTLTAMGESSTALNAASTGAALALGFLGAPVWLTIAAGLGILAAGTALVLNASSSSLPPGADTSVTLARSSDGKIITITQPAPISVVNDYPVGSVPAPVPPAPSAMMDPVSHGVMYQGAAIYRTPQCMSGDPCSAYPALPSGQKNFTRDYIVEAVVLKSLADVQAYDTYEQQYNSASAVVGQSGYDNGGYDSLSVRVYFKPNADSTSSTLYEDRVIKVRDASGNPVMQQNSQPATWWLAGPGVAPISGTDLSQIYPQLTDATKAALVDPLTLASLVNQTWQHAAALPDYQGLPYSASQPVTSTDVQPWINENPSLAPHLDDFFRPATNAGTSTVPISPTATPTTTPSTNPANPSNPASTPATDPSTSTGQLCGVNGVVCTMNVNVLGDPSTPSPSLESTPTINMILSPILNLFPDLKAWALPAHSAVCPQPSFEMFGKTYTISSHCDLAEQNRTAITAVFTAAFALAALFIVLAA